MARSTVLMLVQVVTPIMNLVMTPLALVVVLVVLDQVNGRHSLSNDLLLPVVGISPNCPNVAAVVRPRPINVMFNGQDCLFNRQDGTLI